MIWNNTTIKIAILDMNALQANQGMRCIREIVNTWSSFNHIEVLIDEFEVRIKQEIPDTSYDIYISSGGPGSPLESEGSQWEEKYFDWLTEIENWNNKSEHPPKHVFFICHSFQLICRYYNIAKVCKRKSTSFGIFPVHFINNEVDEIIFKGLQNPFYAVDSRDYQVIEPNENKVKKLGATLLAIEKERPHVPLERAIMAIRFNEYFIGTQFHPEADAIGMSMYLQRADKKQIIIETHGAEKWQSMLTHLNDPDKILCTYHCILPNFLNHAIESLAIL